MAEAGAWPHHPKIYRRVQLAHTLVFRWIVTSQKHKGATREGEKKRQLVALMLKSPVVINTSLSKNNNNKLWCTARKPVRQSSKKQLGWPHMLYLNKFPLQGTSREQTATYDGMLHTPQWQFKWQRPSLGAKAIKKQWKMKALFTVDLVHSSNHNGGCGQRRSTEHPGNSK